MLTQISKSILTGELLSLLWQRYGETGYPAEWDGLNYGGSKMSQRFWEYMRAIQLLELENESSVMDIGGGSMCTQRGFFAEILAEKISLVTVLDGNVEPSYEKLNICYLQEFADEKSLSKLRDSGFSHIVSVSALEHIEPQLRREIMRNLNEFAYADTMVFTFEYHPTTCYFEHHLTAKDMDVFRELTNFYVDAFEASPTHCVNAVDKWYPVIVRFKRKF
jgi:hypothetical protein